MKNFREQCHCHFRAKPLFQLIEANFAFRIESSPPPLLRGLPILGAGGIGAVEVAPT
jgi:hypothetical protein